MSHGGVPGGERKVSTRDRTELHRQICAWVAVRSPGAIVSGLSSSSANGFSSETLMFNIETDGTTRECVLRLPPDPAALPAFEHYDMAKQYRAMQLVAERTTVPVPPLLWLEEDPTLLGAPFFVMGRVDGVVPPDKPPYVFGGNFLFDAAPDEAARLQRSSIEVVAALHRIGTESAGFLEPTAVGATPLRRHLAEQRAYYDWVVADSERSPLLERALRWLEASVPDESPAAFSWGDSRIGNIMYRNFQPVAVLDWEMASIAPPQVDLGWMIFLHRFFHDLATPLGFPGMPGFMCHDDVRATYHELTGDDPGDLRWYMAYAAIRQGIIMFRITRRQVMFGEKEPFDNPDHSIRHHATIAAMLDGSHWDSL